MDKKNKKEILNKKIAQKLMSIPGNCIGEMFCTNAEYIRRLKGEDGLRAIEEKIKKLGYSLKFRELKPSEWYPEGLGALVIIAAKEIFDWTESDVFKMGNLIPKHSFIVRMLMRHLGSLSAILKISSKMWYRHFDFGKLEIGEVNEKEKYLIIRVKGYNFHPLICFFHQGYFLRIAQYTIKSEEIIIKESKCQFKGDSYHEYIISWK